MIVGCGHLGVGTFCSCRRGGTKLSGFGRDNGEAGFMSYLEPKQVVEWVTKDRLGWYNMPAAE